MYLSSCTYMQFRRVDLSCVSGLPTFHMLRMPLYVILQLACLLIQYSSKHTLCYVCIIMLPN